MASINIVFDSNNPNSPKAAAYLAESIRTTGNGVGIYTLGDIADGRMPALGNGSDQTTIPVISLTPAYRPHKSSQVVYWLDSRSFGQEAQVDNLFARFKQVFVDFMSFSSVRGFRVLVDCQTLKNRLSPYVRGVDVLRLPPAYTPQVLPGKYGRSIAFEFGRGADLDPAAFAEFLKALALVDINEIVLFGTDIMFANEFVKGMGDEGPVVQLAVDLDEFAQAVARGLAYVGIGIDRDLSFERVAIAAALLRPAVFFDSTVDDRYFVDQVTGFDARDLRTLGDVLRLLAAGEIDPQLVGECLSLFFMKRYGPEVVLMEALK